MDLLLRSAVEASMRALTVLIRPDRAGNLFEIGVVSSGEGPIVMHAMQARAVNRSRDP